MLSSTSSRKTKSNVPALPKQHSERETDREIDTHVIDHDHQDHKPSVLQQNSSKERSRRNNKKKKVYANTSLFSLRAEEEEDEEEDLSLENSKD
jgi:metal-dependent hydrolase (beta-lactamase superfamily II)